MTHPFVAGRRYRNRVGEYEVLSIAEPTMTVRYRDGRTAEVNIDIQTRIWNNIRLETVATDDDDTACETPEGDQTPGAAFDGLKVSDFQQGASGTCWRARSGLGGLLAHKLSEVAGQPFVSFAIFRRPQVHVVVPDCYTKQKSAHKAKLLFQLDPDQATFGFYIEKSDRLMDKSWDWRQLLGVLRADTNLQTLVEAAMREHDLAWEIYLSDSRVEDALFATITAGDKGLSWSWETKEQVDTLTWGAFVDRLAALRRDAWADIYLGSHLSRGKAIIEGVRIADRAVAVYAALLPLYVASTCPI
jgi:hypothetical protein